MRLLPRADFLARHPIAFPLLAVLATSCGRDNATAQRTAAGAQAKPRQAGLDSLAAASQPLSPEFHQQLRGYVFRPDGTILLHGAHQLTILAPAGRRDLVSAGENEQITTATNGSHFGRLRLDEEVVARFELAVVGGSVLWTHDRRGHHYYQIGPDAGVVVGMSTDMAHPGKPGTMGTFVFYDRRGVETGRFSCMNPGASTFTPDGAALLVSCRGDGLHLVGPDGRSRRKLEGDYRDVAAAQGARVIAAVNVAHPSALQVAGLERAPRAIQLAGPVRGVALTRAGNLAVVAAGTSVYGVRPDTGAIAWELKIPGTDPVPTAIAVGDHGLVAVGALLDGARALAGHDGPHPAVLVVARDGRILRSVEFDVAQLAIRVPAVAVSPDEKRLIVSDPTRIWVIDVARVAP